MHPVPASVVDLDRQEGPCPDMQRYAMNIDATIAERCLQRRREMQPCGRRSHCPVMGGEHGLIVGGVARVGGALGRDIGRQRRIAELRDGLIEARPVKCKRQRDLAVLALMLDLRIEMTEQANPALIAEADDVTGRELFGRLDQRLPARTIEPLDQRRLDLRLGLAADAPARELRRDHPGIVDHQLIAGLEPLRQLGDDSIAPDAVGRHHQQPRGIAWIRRAQRDAGGGEFEVENIGAHVQTVIAGLDPAIHPLRKLF